MGLFQKKEESHEDGDDIQIIFSGDSPDGIDASDVELVEGTSAEHVAAGTTAEKEAERAEKEMLADAADEALMPKDEDDSDEDETEDGSDDGDGTERRKKSKTPIIVAVAVVLAIVAAIGGYFVGSGGFGQKGISGTTLTEDQLDTTVATFTYNGATTNITAREAIESQYSLDSVKNDDDTYPTPSADVILSYARNQILLKEADSRGITVSDDEMTEYAEDTLGTSDYETMASQYGVSEDQAKTIVKQQTTLQKLYKQIVGDTSATMPDAPTEPEDGNEDTASKEYADYIINLAGDEWDSETGTWASTDGTYAQALSGQEFTADSATYSQALTAYYTAYQEYASASSEASSTWTDFANGLYALADLSIYGLNA